MPNMKKLVKLILILSGIGAAIGAIIFSYLFIGKAPQAKNITWGADFSQMQAETLGLDWRQAYLAIINNLGAKNIKLHTQWDWVEGRQGNFYFDDIDWQISQAQFNNAKIIYVLGMKTGRWPECHLPNWANNLSKQEQQDGILKYITRVVERYKSSPAIAYWQVENEPLFNFGQCPWYDKEFLKREVQLVKSLDPERQIIISDSGEQSSWFGAAKIGDIVGITMYRKVWVHIIDGIGFPADWFVSPVYYWRRAGLVSALFRKKVICIELQAEPWAETPYYNLPLEEQYKTMNPEQFKKNVEYAKQTGLDTFYFWGAEWWYRLKTQQNRPEIWNEAQKLFLN